MSKLQTFAYKPSFPSTDPPPQSVSENTANPGTPMPHRIPLSDLISSTPSTKIEVGQDISPDDKIVWKLSPKRAETVPQASQGSPNTRMAEFINFLQNENTNQKVLPM
jgi:hypothetical protein